MRVVFTFGLFHEETHLPLGFFMKRPIDYTQTSYEERYD